MAGVVTIDDRNRAISYSGRWFPQRVRNPNIVDQTVTFTSDEGAQAILEFTGELGWITIRITLVAINIDGDELHKSGSSITVIGSVVANAVPPMSMYMLDDENPVEFIPTPSRTPQNGLVFYRSPTLPVGRHTLTIVNAQDNTSPLILDAFTINTEPQPDPPGGPAPNQPTPTASPTLSLPLPLSTSPGTSTALTSTGQTASVVPVPAPVPSPATSDDLPLVVVTITASKSSSASVAPTPGSNGALSGSDSGASGEKSGGGSNAGAIAGGVVAAIFGIGLLIVAFLFWRRRQRQRRSEGGPQPLRRGHSSFWNKPAGPNPTSPPITPFVLDSDLPPSPPTQAQRRPPPPPPQMSQHPYNQASSRAYNPDPYGQSYQFSTAPQNIPPPIVANNRFSTADSMYTDGPDAREDQVDPYGGYAPSSAAPPPPLPNKGPTLAIANPFYPQAVNQSVPDLSQQPQSQPQSSQSPFRNPPQRTPTTLQYVPPSQNSTSQYVPPSQLLNSRLQGGGSGSGYDSYGRGMPVPNSDPSYMYATQSQGKRERIRLD
ncbi:hypothetical protein BJ165DRAFT_1531902 [Panaeolus papilionaceus]|nr:hypothetical protein BJ165DRAFT_1531902 [Panaeolus papilionaceus]